MVVHLHCDEQKAQVFENALIAIGARFSWFTEYNKEWVMSNTLFGTYVKDVWRMQAEPTTHLDKERYIVIQCPVGFRDFFLHILAPNENMRDRLFTELESELA